MNIGAVSKASGLPDKTIRYYEDIGLIRPARGANGYRDFSQQDLHKLVFLARARSLGFSIEDCRILLSLYEDRSRASADVKALAQEHIRQIEDKVAKLLDMRDSLSELVASCHGDQRPECPILDGLAGEGILE
ncbi:Cu(I)-responsive transcriptional regulator [Paracoccus sp. Z330]|uniref:Cu(I)-responsive transcriptional regulator n=1 Tax=Paracoccus onchidii TaxID=3017813 RepID=A0ABT4ZJQ0_9RHOB|nr:Cu(I)-responsive transcriptional regulator [Paracoccus onchidii]MDB6179538.1 Cu(I)-responsive transcriptional regulator [Paracoccus onchidii]